MTSAKLTFYFKERSTSHTCEDVDPRDIPVCIDQVRDAANTLGDRVVNVTIQFTYED